MLDISGMSDWVTVLVFSNKKINTSTCLSYWWLALCYISVAESNKSPIATIVIRGATDNLMDDIERAIDDGVNAYKALTKVLVSRERRRVLNFS